MNDDILTLYYYADGLSADERRKVEAALQNDASLRERYRTLSETLDGFSDPPTTGAPGHIVARWHGSIDRAAAAERATRRPSRGWHLPSFACGAVAAALVCGVAMAVWLRAGLPETSPVEIAGQGRPSGADGNLSEESRARFAVPVAFSRGLQVHLRQSRQEIMQLADDDGADRTMLVMDILRQNRLFERAAQENNADDIARVLRSIEPVLLRLATEDLSTTDAAALKSKLTFELNVVLTKMAQGESDDTQSI